MSRIVLRNLGPEDKQAVIEMLLDPEVMRFLGPRRALDTSEALEWFQTEIEKPSRFVVALRNTNELIGFCGIKNLDGVIDFGYFLRKSFWGKGYATEACRAAILALKEKVNFDEVQVFIAEANEASLAIAKNLGWQQLQEATKENETGYNYRVRWKN